MNWPTLWLLTAVTLAVLGVARPPATDQSLDSINQQVGWAGNPRITTIQLAKITQSIGENMAQLKELRTGVKQLGRKLNGRRQGQPGEGDEADSDSKAFRKRVRDKIHSVQRRLRRLEKSLQAQKLAVRLMKAQKKKAEQRKQRKKGQGRQKAAEEPGSIVSEPQRRPTSFRSTPSRHSGTGPGPENTTRPAARTTSANPVGQEVNFGKHSSDIFGDTSRGLLIPWHLLSS